MKIIRSVNTNPYDDSKSDVVMGEVSSLDNDDLRELLGLVVDCFKQRDINDELVKELKRYNVPIYAKKNLPSMIDGFKIKEVGVVYTVFGNQTRSVSLTDKISDYELERMYKMFKNDDVSILIPIETPDTIHKQLNAYKNKLNARSKVRLTLKKGKELEKAKKIIEKYEMKNAEKVIS